MDRSELLEKLDYAVLHLDEIEKYKIRVNTANAEVTKLERKKARIERNTKAVAFICYSMALLHLFLVFYVLLSRYFRLSVVIICAVLALGWMLSLILHKTVFKKRHQIAAQKFEAEQVLPAEQAVHICQMELDNVKNDLRFAEVLSLMPDYCTPEALGWITRAVRNNRADTLKDAINLYEDALHKGLIEHLTREQRDVAAQTERNTNAAAKAAKSTEWNTTFSNVMTASKMRSKKK